MRRRLIYFIRWYRLIRANDEAKGWGLNRGFAIQCAWWWSTKHPDEVFTTRKDRA